MANTTKKPTNKSPDLVTRQAYNDNLSTLGVDGFVGLKVGHKITQTISTTTVPNDTETFEYFDSAVSLMQLKVIYTDGNRDILLSVERIA